MGELSKRLDPLAHRLETPRRTRRHLRDLQTPALHAGRSRLGEPHLRAIEHPKTLGMLLNHHRGLVEREEV